MKQRAVADNCDSFDTRQHQMLLLYAVVIVQRHSTQRLTPRPSHTVLNQLSFTSNHIPCKL